MDIQVRVWRQSGPGDKGRMVGYDVKDISPDASFLEMLDVLNEKLILDGDDPVAFDHDCREGICGMCGMMINGVAHGPERATTTCQLHMRAFRDGDTKSSIEFQGFIHVTGDQTKHIKFECHNFCSFHFSQLLSILCFYNRRKGMR